MSGRWRLARPKAPVVVSANCLLGGHVLYLDSAREWVTRLELAQRFDCVDTAKEMAVTADDPALIIGVDLVEVRFDQNEITARHYREIVRAKGPGPYVYPHALGDGNVSL